jgi:transcriptional regulator with XRE-family HTH domain
MSGSPSQPTSTRRFYKRPPFSTDAISRAVTSRLLNLHEASGLSEYQAAKKAHLSHNTIFKLRTRLSIPSIDTMLRLAVVYGVDPATLITPVDTAGAPNGPRLISDHATGDLAPGAAVSREIFKPVGDGESPERTPEIDRPDRASADNIQESITT